MPQIINTNVAALNAQRNLSRSQGASDSALQRLSSGLRINSAKDDAAGLAISTRFDSQVRGTNVAIRNAGDGVSLVQTAEGALNSITTNLQRIRELALQSSNDTNTDVDREALNDEVQQLLEEIEATSAKASFNGRKLLDGSLTKASFQTGANVGEKIEFGIAKTTVDSLGTAIGNGISSDAAGTAVSDLDAGDLVINGIAVGASSSSDDTASTSAAASSAIAKAAAINRVSEQTGVTATANKNFIGGNDIGANGASAGIVLNGLSVEVTLSGATAAVRSSQMSAAINAISGQTGVRAEIADDPDGGINLIADDGRNIVLAAGSGALTAAGVGAAGTYGGSFTLASKDGSEIEITSNTGSVRAHAGLEVGTYSGGNSGALAGGGTVGGAGLTALVEGDLVINGVAVGATDSGMDTASTSLASSSAIAKAVAINRVSDQTGVTAEVMDSKVVSGAVATLTATTIAINNVATLVIAAQANVGLQMQAIVDAVNGISGQTGVSAAVLDGDQYTLTAGDGRNINIAVGSNAGGLTAGTYSAGVMLKSAGTIELTTNTANIANSGFSVGEYGGASSGTLLQDLDISTVEGAESAITAIDNALKTVTRSAAKMGAIQSRFESTISNLSVTNENLAAANSRIRDADFAAETAALSRSQVLQQAGISVLAQANARPQQVLSLLQ